MTIALNDIGLRNGIDQASSGHGYLEKYERLFEGRSIRHLAIVLGTRPIAIANTFAEFLPDAEIAAISYAPVDGKDAGRLRSNVRLHRVNNLIAIHRALAHTGPVDVLIEDSPNKKSQKREIFRLFFPSLRDGGLYVAEDLHASYIPSLLDDDKEELWQMMSRLLSLKASGGREPARAGADDLNLVEAMGRVQFDGKLLSVERSGNAAVKLRHAQTNEILQEKYGDTWGRVVTKLPAMVITSDALVSANNSDLAAVKLPNPIAVPDLYVREYHDVVAFPRQILVKDSMVLPDTFRLSLTVRLNNTALSPLNHYFARLPAHEQQPECLEGQYYYLDLEYNRHFGHFMTEAIPRLYGWDQAKAANPALKLLISMSPQQGELLTYQTDILRAYDIHADDIQIITSPVRVESLISAMPLFHNGKYVHPLLREACERIGAKLVKDSSPAGRRIFVSRKPGMWRECLNMGQLESVFMERGFEVVYPEDLSLAEQATVFANASVVAGYIGSGLYSSMFSPAPIDIIGFINTSYQATNEYFIATALGHRMHMFWCDDIKGNRRVDTSNRALAPTNYDFEFDFERDGAALIEILDSLG